MKFIYTLCVYSVLLASYAQKNGKDTCQYTIKGRLAYSTDSNSIEGAYIYHHHLNHYVFSDSLGYFELSGLCKGIHTLHINHVGTMHSDVQVTAPQDSLVYIFIHPLNQTNEIIVHGAIPNSTSSEGSFTSELSGKQLEARQGESLGQMLTSIPGVNNLQTGPTIFKPMIQGMYGSRLLIINQSVRQEGQQWGSEHAPEIDPYTAGRIEVIRGAQSLRYGPDAMGGVILIEPKKFRLEHGTDATLSLGATSVNRGYSLSSSINHRFKKIPALAIGLQGSFKQGGNVRTPDYWLENTGLKELNGSATAEFNQNNWNVRLYTSKFSTQVGIFTGSHIGNTTDLIHAIYASQPNTPSYFSYTIGRPYQQVEHDLSTLRISKKIHAHNSVTFQYARQYDERKEFDAHGVLQQQDASLVLKLTTHTSNLSWDHRLSEKLHGSVGVMYQYQKNTYQGRYFIPNFESHLIGAYAYETYHITKTTALEAGLRYDYKSLQSYYYKLNELASPFRTFENITYSFGVHQQFLKNGNLKILIANAFRSPHASELYSNGVHHGAAAVEIGNESLSAEKGINASIYADKSFHKFVCFAYGSTYFFDNYIYLQPVQPPSLTIRGAFPTFQYTQVKANYYALDIGAHDTIAKNWLIRSNLSMVQAYDKTQNQWILNIPSTQLKVQLEHSLSLVKKWKPEFYVACIQVFKKQHVQTNDYAPAPEGYLLLNLGLQLSPKIKNQSLLYVFEINNLLNTVYRNYTDRMRYYNDAAGRSFNMKIFIPINN